MEEDLKELAVILYDVDAVKFGDFLTKVGLRTPIYIDLRVIITYPEIMHKLSKTLWTFSKESKDVSHICGVPYTALPIATLISVDSKTPMLIRRKETKSYGTKKTIEGQYKPGDTCTIIEDVVTSGSSILETVNDLRKEGLNVTEAYVVVDREQGGRKNLEAHGVNMKCLFTVTELIKYLVDAGKVTEEMADKVAQYVKDCQAPLLTNGLTTKRTKMDFDKRAKLTKNPIVARLLRLMDTKQSTVCLAADLTRTDSILQLAEIAGPHIPVLKVHVDIIEDYNDNFVKQLKQLAKKHEFLIMEDRKFGDIGHVAFLQLRKGMYKIAEWADLITVHSVSGSGVVDGLQKGFQDIGEDRGVFLVAEMSSEGTLTNGEYAKATVKMAERSGLVAGFVCQTNIFDDPSLIQLTPGVKIGKSTDELGQQYNTPAAVVERGADLAVVGRGIVEAQDQLSALLQYKEELWNAYESRIKSSA